MNLAEVEFEDAISFASMIDCLFGLERGVSSDPFAIIKQHKVVYLQSQQSTRRLLHASRRRHCRGCALIKMEIHASSRKVTIGGSFVFVPEPTSLVLERP